jgi:uncharacterized membrane protein YdbT with pleckstrin-like domain
MNVKDHLQPGEEILYEARPSLVPLAPALALVAVLAIAGVLAWRLVAPPGGHWLALLCAAGAAAAAIAALARYVRLVANRYILTNRRILRLTGLVSRSSMDSYLDKINNVEHHQDLWGRLFGYGDVEIDTASGVGAEVFRRISHPLAWKRAVDAAASAYHNPVNPAAAPSATAAPAATAGAEKMRQLKQLLDEGLISQAEYDAKRARVLEEI